MRQIKLVYLVCFHKCRGRAHGVTDQCKCHSVLQCGFSFAKWTHNGTEPTPQDAGTVHWSQKHTHTNTHFCPNWHRALLLRPHPHPGLEQWRQEGYIWDDARKFPTARSRIVLAAWMRFLPTPAFHRNRSYFWGRNAIWGKYPPLDRHNTGAKKDTFHYPTPFVWSCCLRVQKMSPKFEGGGDSNT